MIKAKRPNWAGKTVAVIASGPSLTMEDCEAVRAAGLVTIVTNTTFRNCLWADVLFGYDAKFWSHYAKEISENFLGRLVTHAQTLQGIEVETTYGSEWFRGVGNSGACAIGFALAGLPKRVILLGCDSEIKPGGKAHHHGNHPPTMSNCLSIKRWPKDFMQVAAEARMLKIPVINASRHTCLTCFPRASLSELLAEAASCA